MKIFLFLSVIITHKILRVHEHFYIIIICIKTDLNNWNTATTKKTKLKDTLKAQHTFPKTLNWLINYCWTQSGRVYSTRLQHSRAWRPLTQQYYFTHFVESRRPSVGCHVDGRWRRWPGGVRTERETRSFSNRGTNADSHGAADSRESYCARGAPGQRPPRIVDGPIGCAIRLHATSALCTGTTARTVYKAGRAATVRSCLKLMSKENLQALVTLGFNSTICYL